MPISVTGTFQPSGAFKVADLADLTPDVDTDGFVATGDGAGDIGMEAASAHGVHPADAKRVIGILVSDPGGDAITTGTDKATFRIPSVMNGWELLTVEGHLTTVGTGTATTVMVQKRSRTNATTRTADVDMLATIMTIDASEFDTIDAAAAVPKTDGKEDVVTGDHIMIDIVAVGTGAKGLFVELTFQLP